MSAYEYQCLDCDFQCNSDVEFNNHINNVDLASHPSYWDVENIERRTPPVKQPEDQLIEEVFVGSDFGTVWVRRAPNGSVLVDIDREDNVIYDLAGNRVPSAGLIITVDDFVVFNNEVR